MNGVGIFFIILIVLLAAGAVGWVVFTQLRARRLGLPAPNFSAYNPFARSESSHYGTPSPAPGGIRGWINDKLRSRNDRSAAGAYEQPLQSSGEHRNRGFGPLDPDEAWDTRVGHEADTYGPGGYYEEQELGLRNDPYTGNGYPMNLASSARAPSSGYGDTHAHEQEHRGRSRDRDSLGIPGRAANPFDDSAAEPSNISLRGVSPRPIDTNAGAKAGGSGPASDSPTERRSVFRENM